MLDHLPGKARIAFHLGRDGVERVEEKMRVKLHAQGIEPRFGEAALEPLHAQLA